MWLFQALHTMHVDVCFLTHFVALYVHTIDHNLLVNTNGKGKPLIRGKLKHGERLINEPSIGTAWMEYLLVLGKEAQWSGAITKCVQLATLRFSFSLFMFSPYSLKWIYWLSFFFPFWKRNSGISISRREYKYC